MARSNVTGRAKGAAAERNAGADAKAGGGQGARPAKREQLVRLLEARRSPDIETLSAKLGWQPHSTRAALSGLRKSGVLVERIQPSNGGASRYRIVRQDRSIEAKPKPE